MFCRTRELERQNSILEEALAEVYPTTVYYLDKLGGKGIDRAFVYAVEDSERLCVKLENDLGLKASVLFPQFLADQTDPRNRRLVNTSAPLLGLLASRKVAYT